MKTLSRFFLVLAGFTALFITACEPLTNDPASGDIRDDYTGVWKFVESFKSTQGQTYLVTIVKDPTNSSQVILQNFGNPGSDNNTAIGIVTSSQIVVSRQTLTNTSWIVEGSGSFSNAAKTTMNWAFSITAGGSKDDYTATVTKQ